MTCSATSYKNAQNVEQTISINVNLSLELRSGNWEDVGGLQRYGFAMQAGFYVTILMINIFFVPKII